ncbi:unnamed protein product [Protopolystoma xenopodis]|uniref:Uncharacterized protein n=1 Tax=Protopolystoma xenopodis TaxID=117903 RepID=A0A3S4ZKN8_9PLAT|nr:unnamed protein product [Protopolystoma xenopodis]
MFRDTLSTDCMQSSEKLVGRSTPRAYKINWSVGSYGIFIRRRSKHQATTHSPRKWHEFHASWLRNYFDQTELLRSANSFTSRIPTCSAAKVSPFYMDGDPEITLSAPVSNLEHNEDDLSIGGTPEGVSQAPSRLESSETEHTALTLTEPVRTGGFREEASKRSVFGSRPPDRLLNNSAGEGITEDNIKLNISTNEAKIDYIEDDEAINKNKCEAKAVSSDSQHDISLTAQVQLHQEPVANKEPNGAVKEEHDPAEYTHEESSRLGQSSLSDPIRLKASDIH